MVVTISKVGSGYARYLVDTVRAIVVAVLSNAARYYGASTPEHRPGCWYGSGVEALVGREVGDEVTASDLESLMQGSSPVTGDPLVQNAGPGRPCFDICIDSSKRHSLLWALADDPEVRTFVEDAYLTAFETAVLPHLEDLVFTRRGHGGKVVEKGESAFAVFMHTTSRASEPAVHLHCLFAGCCLRADGTTGAVLTERLFQAQRGLDAAFQVELSLRLNPFAHELARIPESLVRAMSSRREEILLEAGGADSPASARQQAAYETRDAKEKHQSPQLFVRWRAIAMEHGYEFGRAREQSLGATHQDLPPDANAEERVVREDWLLRRELDGLEELSRSTAVEDRESRSDETRVALPSTRQSPRFLERLVAEASLRLAQAGTAVRANLSNRLLEQLSLDNLYQYGVYNLRRPLRSPTHPHELESLRKKAQRAFSPKNLVYNATLQPLLTGRSAREHQDREHRAAAERKRREEELRHER